MKIYILNIAICKFSMSTKQQDMYAPFLGDMNAVDTFIKRISKVNKYSSVDFSNLTSLYLTYYTETTQKFSRNNKQVIFELLNAYKEAISSVKEEKCFVFLLHTHGDQQSEKDLYNIVVDNNCANPDDEVLGGSEILQYLRPIVEVCNTYLILNSCFSNANSVLNLDSSFKNFQKKYVAFADVLELQDLKTKNFLKILGMSSQLVKGNIYMENTYGIRILKSIFQMGVDFSDSQVFDLLKMAIEMADLKDIYPNFITVQQTNVPSEGTELELKHINVNKDAENFLSE